MDPNLTKYLSQIQGKVNNDLANNSIYQQAIENQQLIQNKKLEQGLSINQYFDSINKVYNQQYQNINNLNENAGAKFYTIQNLANKISNAVSQTNNNYASWNNQINQQQQQLSTQIYNIKQQTEQQEAFKAYQQDLIDEDTKRKNMSFWTSLGIGLGTIALSALTFGVASPFLALGDASLLSGEVGAETGIGVLEAGTESAVEAGTELGVNSAIDTGVNSAEESITDLGTSSTSKELGQETLNNELNENLIQDVNPEITKAQNRYDNFLNISNKTGIKNNLKYLGRKTFARSYLKNFDNVSDLLSNGTLNVSKYISLQLGKSIPKSLLYGIGGFGLTSVIDNGILNKESNNGTLGKENWKKIFDYIGIPNSYLD